MKATKENSLQVDQYKLLGIKLTDSEWSQIYCFCRAIIRSLLSSIICGNAVNQWSSGIEKGYKLKIFFIKLVHEGNNELLLSLQMIHMVSRKMI